MILKFTEKQLAISMRKEGKSYREILKKVPVAKSTLSYWLGSVNLTNKQKYQLTQKKLQAALRGAAAQKQKRIKKEIEMAYDAKIELGKISKRDLLMIGIALYWAEGEKIKSYSPTVSLKFTNSDPKMIRIFLAWCYQCQNLTQEDISVSLYIHEDHFEKKDHYIQYWSTQTGIKIAKFDKIYRKRGNPLTVRKNTGDNYSGQITITVKKSVNLNRKIVGYVDEIANQCGVV